MWGHPNQHSADRSNDVSPSTFFALIKQFVVRAQQHDATGLAAQLAYYFLLSLFPFLIFAITLLGYTAIDANDILELIARYAPGQTAELIEGGIRNVLENKHTGLLSFGIIATIWTASNALNAIIQALDHAYDVEESRSFSKTRVLAVLLTFLMIFVILVSLLLPVFGRMIGLFIFSILGIPSAFFLIWNLIRWMLSFFVMAGAFVCLYYFAPNRRMTIKEVTAGAIFSTIGWQLASLGFSYYVENFGNYTATYGSLGGIIILMLWFYLTALIIILGGELNAVLHAPRENRTRVETKKDYQ